MHHTVPAASVTVAKGGNNPHPSTGERVNLVWRVHTVEYYAGKKRVPFWYGSQLNAS